MDIKKREGIRESFRECELILFNTYTYERLKMKGAASEFWQQISAEYITTFFDKNMSEKTAQIIRFLDDKKYIEVTN